MSIEERVKQILAERKMVMLSTIAEECSITELEAARALPDEMRAFCAGSQFKEVWERMGQWPKATFIMTHCGNVLEVRGKIPSGKESNGYFNLDHDAPLSGHLRSDLVTDICFLSLPFMGLESHSVHFFGADGAVIFSVYVGREKRVLIPEALEGFMSMRNGLGKE